MFSRIAVSALVIASATPLTAAQHGPFSYGIDYDKGEVYLSEVTGEVTGFLAIPSEIKGYPVTRIETWPRDAFLVSHKVTSVFVPATITYMDPVTFQGASSLTHIEVDDANPFYGDIDGVLYDKVSMQIIRCPKAKSGPFVIPDFIVSIYGGSHDEDDYFDGAFEKCALLTEVTIPGFVSYIPQYSFTRCFSLQRVFLGEGVEEIGPTAFGNCDSLVEIDIPSSMNFIHGAAFGCQSAFGAGPCDELKNIFVHPDNPVYLDIDGVLFSKDGKELIRYPYGRPGPYVVPPGVESIRSGDEDSFPFGLHGALKSKRLTSLTLPASLFWIGLDAIDSPVLLEVVFSGDSPEFFYDEISLCLRGHDNIKFYFLRYANGFFSEEWSGYDTYTINEVLYLAARWFLANGFQYDTDLGLDHNGDGVSFRLAYALGLDPVGNLASSLPVPELGPSHLGITFYAASPGVSYTVETSDSLGGWTTDGVELSDFDDSDRRTATVNRTEGARFLRLVVE